MVKDGKIVILIEQIIQFNILKFWSNMKYNYYNHDTIFLNKWIIKIKIRIQTKLQTNTLVSSWEIYSYFLRIQKISEQNQKRKCNPQRREINKSRIKNVTK